MLLKYLKVTVPSFRKTKNERRFLNYDLFLSQVFPNTKCKLRLLKLERIKDFLLMEEEFIRNQELRKPREEQDEVIASQLQITICRYKYSLLFDSLVSTE